MTKSREEEIAESVHELTRVVTKAMDMRTMNPWPEMSVKARATRIQIVQDMINECEDPHYQPMDKWDLTAHNLSILVRRFMPKPW